MRHSLKQFHCIHCIIYLISYHIKIVLQEYHFLRYCTYRHHLRCLKGTNHQRFVGPLNLSTQPAVPDCQPSPKVQGPATQLLRAGQQVGQGHGASPRGDRNFTQSPGEGGWRLVGFLKGSTEIKKDTKC